MEPQLVFSCAFAMLAALWMTEAGKSTHLLVSRFPKRKCASCGRVRGLGGTCPCNRRAKARRGSKAL